MTRNPRSFGIRLGRVERSGLVKQTQRSVDGDHLVVMREVGVECAVKRECDRRCI